MRTRKFAFEINWPLAKALLYRWKKNFLRKYSYFKMYLNLHKILSKHSYLLLQNWRIFLSKCLCTKWKCNFRNDFNPLFQRTQQNSALSWVHIIYVICYLLLDTHFTEASKLAVFYVCFLFVFFPQPQNVIYVFITTRNDEIAIYVTFSRSQNFFWIGTAATSTWL